jgi:DNA mismatch endonuclease (patch repair protein)
MVDVIDTATRSRMMSGIKGKDTQPEMIVRRLLHRDGYRYRLHVSKIPGKPDLVFPKFSALIFVNGCFWHGHDCHLFKWPKTRSAFWREKIRGNIYRDSNNLLKLENMGWRVCIVWECAVKGKAQIDKERLGKLITRWLDSSRLRYEIRGEMPE